MSSNTDSGYSFDDTTKINHTIDHSLDSYALNWRPGGTGNTLQLCGFRIFYQP